MLDSKTPPPKISQETDSEKELKRLQELVEQRDNEINILIGMLKREKRRAAEIMATAKQAGVELPEPSVHIDDLITARQPNTSQSQIESVENGEVASKQDRSSTSEESRKYNNGRPASRLRGRQYQYMNETDLSKARQEAFDTFKRDYSQNGSIEENKRILKQRYSDAKLLGEQVNKTRGSISEKELLKWLNFSS
jgi:kinesin family protein 6/9